MGNQHRPTLETRVSNIQNIIGWGFSSICSKRKYGTNLHICEAIHSLTEFRDKYTQNGKPDRNHMIVLALSSHFACCFVLVPTYDILSIGSACSIQISETISESIQRKHFIIYVQKNRRALVAVWKHHSAVLHPRLAVKSRFHIGT